GPVQVTALNLPAGLTLGGGNQPTNLPAGKDEGGVVLTVQSAVTPGTYTIAFRGQMQLPFNKDPMAKQRPNAVAVQPSAPVTLTVLPKQAATLTVTPAAAKLKPGAQTEVVVRVTRMHDFTGPFKVELVLPANSKGIAAEAVTIPAGKDEA